MRAAIVCPKCQRERKPGQDACARCGLLVSRWEGFVPELPSLPPVDEAWARLQSRWQDDQAHQHFLDQSAQFDGLDVAAALYREAHRQKPDDPRAEEGLRRAAVLAQTLYAARSRAERSRIPAGAARVASLAGASAVLAAALAAFYFMFRR